MCSEKMIEIVSRYTKYPETNIFLDSFLVDDLGADSVVLYSILSAIEEEFEIEEVPDEEIVKAKTVRDLCDTVSKYALST